jgi:hypothetical protein
MGDQFLAMQTWPSSLTSSQHPTLAALAPELEPLLKAADSVLTTKKNAEQQRSAFREVGERKDFIDRANAARKEAYGVLSTIPHKNIGLPLSFADQFFRRDRAKTGEHVTLPALEAKVVDLEAELAETKALRDAMKAAEEKAAQEAAEAEAAREAAKAELAALQKELAAKEKHAAALKALIEANA